MDNDAITTPTTKAIDSFGDTGQKSDRLIPNSSNGESGTFAQISHNPFFTAGLGLAGLGVILNGAQRGIRRGASLLKRRLLVDVEINYKDESYPWFLHWMTAHQRSQISKGSTSDVKQAPNSRKGGLLQLLLQRFIPGIHHLSIKTDKTEHANGSVQTHFSLIPGLGKHILRYKNAFIMVDRVRETKSMDINIGKPWETITLTTLYSQRHVFEDLFTEAHRLAQQFTEGKIIVYTPRAVSWEKFGEPRRKRPIESVILDKGVKGHIVEDVKDFLSNAKWYYDRGIPYRRGYLLHGPPGSGKSSFIQALAGNLDYNIAMLNLSEWGLTDDRLNYLLTIVPRRSLVLLEDADAAFSNRRTQTDSDGYRGANVTFSGLLNALDGVASAEERLLFLTSNHAERLDSALVRPGRIDMTVRIGEATRWQAAKLWDRFYGELDPQGAYKARFLDRLQELGLIVNESSRGKATRSSTSAAALQGLFLYNKGNMEGAITMTGSLLRQHLSSEHTNETGTRPAQALQP